MDVDERIQSDRPSIASHVVVGVALFIQINMVLLTWSSAWMEAIGSAFGLDYDGDACAPLAFAAILMLFNFVCEVLVEVERSAFAPNLRLLRCLSFFVVTLLLVVAVEIFLDDGRSLMEQLSDLGLGFGAVIQLVGFLLSTLMIRLAQRRLY